MLELTLTTGIELNWEKDQDCFWGEHCRLPIEEPEHGQQIMRDKTEKYVKVTMGRYADTRTGSSGRNQMRNAQKQEVLGCIDSLHQAHEEIREALKQKNNILVRNMLSECQEFAMSLGENIEKLEGEGNPAVSCLEEYCETLYHIYGELDSDGVTSDKVNKKLRKQLLRVENSVKNNIHVRKEVVFLPYKASMWDSLESIWKAADEDPDCDAYVIPIPYYDKNPDGSFGERHYEAPLYPKYVPVMHYGEYDFEKRRPDVIFIHNPYDECNYVTSVEPFFYSKNLKRYTEKLVYVPYFILGEIEPDDQQAVEGMKRFCLVPGVMNADKVIVQSEDMRQVYINVLVEASGEQTRKYWEKRILGLGSPKVDKVLNTKKEDLEIPEEWLKIIKKPDGSWKKIVFYNTGVSALLRHDEKMLEKMRDVFKVFYENRDEVALLWRPHPLIKATIESMRPQLWAEYEQIVRKYREDGWGIYDDTADMDRAVCLSDAYYGDGSSVVQLYEKLEKPVMYQSVKVRKFENGKIKVVPYLMEEHEDDIYMIDGIHDALYKLNDEMDKCEFVSYLEGYGKSYPYLAMTCMDDKFFFTPNYGLYCAIYDIEKKRTVYLSLEELGVDRNNIKMASFYQTVKYGDGLYLFGLSNSSVLYIDYLKGKIKKIYEGKHDEDWGTAKPFLIGDYGRYGQNIYIPVFNSDSILVLNMEQQTCNMLELKMGLNMSTACVYNENLYAFGTNGRDMCEISLKDSKKTIYNLKLPEGFYQDCGSMKYAYVFWGTFYYEGYIWLIPASDTNMILKMDVKSKSIDCVIEFNKCYIVNYTIWNDELWIYTLSGLMRVNMKTGEWKKQEIYLEEKDYIAYMSSKNINNICCNEDTDIDLQFFCQKSKKKETIHEKEQKNIYGNIGNKWLLWQTI